MYEINNIDEVTIPVCCGRPVRLTNNVHMGERNLYSCGDDIKLKVIYGEVLCEYCKSKWNIELSNFKLVADFD